MAIAARARALLLSCHPPQRREVSHSKVEFILHLSVSFVVVLGARVIRGGVATFLQVLGQDILAAMMTATLLTMDHIVHDKDH